MLVQLASQYGGGGGGGGLVGQILNGLNSAQQQPGNQVGGQYGLLQGNYQQYPNQQQQQTSTTGGGLYGLVQNMFGFGGYGQMGLTTALDSIARYDDRHCVPRILCEVASGSRPGGAKDLPTSPGFIGRQGLISLLSAWNFDQQGPLWVFGKAALLGLSARGATHACYNAYPSCPRSQDQLVDYLNNHRGGLFRFFSDPYKPYYQSRIQTPQNYDGIQAEDDDENNDNRFHLRIQNNPNYNKYRPQQYQQHYRPPQGHHQSPQQQQQQHYSPYQHSKGQKFLIESPESYQYHTRLQNNKYTQNYYTSNNQYQQPYYQTNQQNTNNHYSTETSKGFSFPKYDSTRDYKTTTYKPAVFSVNSLYGSNQGVRFPNDDDRQIQTSYYGYDHAPGLVLADDTKSFRVQQSIRVQKALNFNPEQHLNNHKSQQLKFPQNEDNQVSNNLFPQD